MGRPAKDPEAGQLQAAAKGAIDKASATIEKASQELATFKNPTNVRTHIDQLQKGVDRLRELSPQLDKTKGKAERDKIKSKIRRETDQVKGHEKDLREKPKVHRAYDENQKE